MLALVVLGGLAIAWAATRGGDDKATTTVVEQAVTLPLVIGQSESVAVARLTRLGLQTAVAREAAAKPAGTVIGQQPLPGTPVRRSTIVQLTVSAGPKPSSTVSVPEVVGLSADDATQKLAAAGLRAQTKTVASDKPVGTVISQAPTAGSDVPRNAVVTLTISKGAIEVTVPDVAGTSEADARTALRSAGLLASVFRVPSDKPTGTVVAQDPRGGERVAKGSKVRINVSKGAPPPPTTTTTATTTTATTTTTVTATTTTATTTTATTTTTPATTTVPDVRGLSQTQARHALRRVGLVAAVAYVNASLPVDQVVAQFPKAGATVKRGARVRINVSLGPKPKPQVAVPDVTSEDENTAIQDLKAAGFTVETADQPTTDASADGVVLDQDPAGGTQAPSGSTVTIFVGRYGGG